MTIDNMPDRPNLTPIDGGSDPSADGRSMLDRARDAMIEGARDAIDAIFNNAAGDSSPYGHLSPVPSPLEHEGDQDDDAADNPSDVPGQAPNVVPITEAPSLRARQIAGGDFAGSSALQDVPIPLSAEGETDPTYHAIKKARLEVEAAVETMPTPDISQMEDLFK